MHKHFDAHRQTQLAWLLTFLFIIAYSVIMSYESILRYETFKASAFDLGNMDQVLWNTIHGRLFQFTNQAIDWYGPPTRLAIHFEPILLPLSLLYAFGANPRIILIFQTLVLAAGAFPVFLLSRRYLPTWPLLATAMAGAYLLMPAVLGLNLFDFHPVSLACPLFLYAMLALVYKRSGWVIVLCILAAACKEDMPLVVAGFGLLIIWKYHQRRLGLLLFIGGFLWSIIAFKFIIPHFYPGVQANNFWYRYESLGSSPAEALINITLHPWVLFTTFFTLDRFYYLVNLLRSGGFLGLLAPEWLLPATFSFAQNLLTTDNLTYSGVYHYNASIIPFVMISSIFGLRRLMTLWQRWRDEPVVTPWYLYVPPARLYFIHGRLQRRLFLWFVALMHVVQRSGTALVRRLAQVRICLWLAIWIKHVAQGMWLWGITHWKRLEAHLIPVARGVPTARFQWVVTLWLALMIAVNFVAISTFLNAFWPDHLPGSHEQHVQQLLAMIPPDASVSAGLNINPHLSERQRLTVFPSISDSFHNDAVQYIIVDLNAVFPEDRVNTVNQLNQLQHSGEYTVIGRAEGVVLLKRRSSP
ncbi:MAG: DUF2079 domain-containing protein [Chloroflexota bacterium]|nr:DUF2079 domain-containing protein [Chloroflexota bacterium]